MQQTVSCPRCGSAVISGTVFCGHCGNSLSWQQQTPQPICQQPSNYQQTERMNWFQRHLNWTFVLVWFSVFVVVLAINLSSYGSVYFDLMNFILRIVGAIILYVLGGWVLKKKGRSLWWLLLIGLFSPALVGNQNTGISNQHIQSSNYETPRGSSLSLTDRYVASGMLHKLASKYDMAIADFSKAIELDPRCDAAYFNRGVCYEAMGYYEMALADYIKTIELDPLDYNAYVNCGVIYCDVNPAIAISYYNKAIELNPRDAETYRNRGIAYMHGSQYDLAITDYNKAIELNPQYAEAYINRGVAYYFKGFYGIAITDFEIVLRISRDPNLINDAKSRIAQINRIYHG